MSLFLSGYKNAFQLIPIENRTLLLEMKQKNRPIPLNAFVRVKKGLYKGDLGQVVRLMEDAQKVVLKLVPRIDMSELNGGSYSALKVRPEQKRFDPTRFPEDKVERKNNARLGGMFYEYNRNFYRDGMLYKEFLVSDVAAGRAALAGGEDHVCRAEECGSRGTVQRGRGGRGGGEGAGGAKQTRSCSSRATR